MKIQSKNSDQKRGGKVGKLMACICGVLVFCLIAAYTQAVNRIITACPSGYRTAIGNLTGVNVVAWHAAEAKTQVELSNQFVNWAVYTKPIILSNDGNKMSQCDLKWNPISGKDEGIMREFLEFAKKNSLSIEYVDSASCKMFAELGLSCPATYPSTCNMEENGQVLTTATQEFFPALSKSYLALIKEYIFASGQAPLTSDGHLEISGKNFKWVDGTGSRTIRLFGFSDLGAVAAGGGLININKYISVLAENKINFTRIFLVNPWSNNHNEMSPFYYDGTGTSTFDLLSQHALFFDRLKRFVKAARLNGIVVQVTLFDACGLEGSPSAFPWSENPYNYKNNTNKSMSSPYDFFNSYFHLININSYPTEKKKYHSTFIDWAKKALVKDDGTIFGNVILEIMNEPVYKENNSTYLNATKTFHQFVVSEINK